jgi:hypothetical protein
MTFQAEIVFNLIVGESSVPWFLIPRDDYTVRVIAAGQSVIKPLINYGVLRR